MSITWDQLIGNTDVFAVRLTLADDPHSGRAVDRETAPSWGAFQLWVNGNNLCAHITQGETLESVHWYLLPLLEWLVESWDPLLHEERLPIRNVANEASAASFETRFAPLFGPQNQSLAWEQEWFDWWQRHCFRSARDGGLSPNVYLRRYRDLIECSWTDEPLAGEPPGFSFLATAGVARLDPAEVAEPLHTAASLTAGELLRRTPESPRLLRLKEALAGLAASSEALQERRIAWLAGLRDITQGTARGTARTGSRSDEPGIFSQWQRVSDVVHSHSPTGNGRVAAVLKSDASPLVVTGSCHAALLFGAVAPSISEADLVALARLLIDSYNGVGDGSELRSLMEDIPLDPAIPGWSQGYELADSIWEQLDFHGTWVDIETIFENLAVSRTTIMLNDRKIRALSIAGLKHAPTVAINVNSTYGGRAEGARFALAHEFCHLLFDRSVGSRLAIASGPWAPRDIERRANAFAAMFLMPSRLVSQTLAEGPGEITDSVTIEEMANRLRVGIGALVRHLYNLGLMDDADRDDLLAHFEIST